MKNNINILLVILILAFFGCKTNKTALSSLGGNNLVDGQSDKSVRPFLVRDLSKETKNNWQLYFSDEFNDNHIDTTKWTVENTTKKRPDVTLYSNNNQVEEKEGKAFIYYRKTN